MWSACPAPPVSPRQRAARARTARRGLSRGRCPRVSRPPASARASDAFEPRVDSKVSSMWGCSRTRSSRTMPYMVGTTGLRAGRAGCTPMPGSVCSRSQQRDVHEFDGELEARYGIGLSSLELLGRLAAADEQRFLLSSLAEAAHLSLSRVSRIVDALGVVSLSSADSVPNDARSVEAQLTGAGLELARSAQATHFAAVEERFFAQLDVDELETLASLFGGSLPARRRPAAAPSRGSPRAASAPRSRARHRFAQGAAASRSRQPRRHRRGASPAACRRTGPPLRARPRR